MDINSGRRGKGLNFGGVRIDGRGRGGVVAEWRLLYAPKTQPNPFSYLFTQQSNNMV
jgi:hypothetical protein